MPTLTQDEIEKLIRTYFRDRLIEANGIAYFAADQDQWERDQEINGTDDVIGTFRTQMATRQFDGVTVSRARKLLDDGGKVGINNLSDEFDTLCTGILRAEAELQRVFAAKLQGIYEDTYPQDPLLRGIVTEELPPLPGQELATGHTVSSVADDYYEFKLNQAWKPKTAVENRRALDWFCDVTGGGKDIRTITTDDIKAFRDVLVRLPANWAKIKEFEGLSLPQIAETYSGDYRLSANSTKKYFANIRAFLGWAVDEEHLDKMPGPNIKLAVSVDNKDQRHPFSKNQLATLFSSPLYRGCASEARRSKSGEFVFRDGSFWLPIIGLFSGMRMGEILQLRSSDVKAEDGIWFFDISNDGQKSLKTSSSVRRIPVHPELERIGFIEFVKERDTDAPGDRLFSEIQLGVNGEYSHNFSKWFTRYLKQINIKTPKTSFHSFRHNYKDALVESGVEESKIKSLLGHADKSVTSAYGSKFSLKLIADEMGKIKYDLDLTDVYISP